MQAREEMQAILYPTATDIKIPDEFICSISQQGIYDPVTTSDGQVYEREAIEEWLIRNDTSPLTGQRLENKALIKVPFINQQIERFLTKNPRLRESTDWYLPKRLIRELESACQRGDVKAIQQLVKQDRRLLVHPFPSHDNQRAMHFAIAHVDSAKAVFTLLEERLLGLGEAVFLERDQAQKLIAHRIKSPDVTLYFKEVISRSASLKAAWVKLFEEAVFRNNFEEAHLFLRFGADINQKDSHGNTLCYRALSQLKADPSISFQGLSWFLAHQDFRINERSQGGRTLLHLAVQHDQVSIVKQLFQARADHQAKDADGNNLLHTAMQWGALNVLKMLFKPFPEENLLLDQKNTAGQTPKEIAVAHKKADVLVLYDQLIEERKKAEKQAIEEQKEKERQAILAQNPVLGLLLLQQQQMIQELQEEVKVLKDELKRKEERPLRDWQNRLHPESERQLIGFFARNVCSPEAVAEFLQHVGWGREEEAEAMLKKMPQLALGYGELTEPAERTFKQITGFQYAIWAHDGMMWDMMMRYLPKEEAAKQLRELNERGTAYGKRFNLGELLKGLQTYIDNYAKWNDEKCKEHFTTVIGNAQRLLPVHCMQEYCCTERSFHPTPDFTKRHRRTISLNIYENGNWLRAEGEKAIQAWYDKKGVEQVGEYHSYSYRNVYLMDYSIILSKNHEGILNAYQINRGFATFLEQRQAQEATLSKSLGIDYVQSLKR